MAWKRLASSSRSRDGVQDEGVFRRTEGALLGPRFQGGGVPAISYGRIAKDVAAAAPPTVYQLSLTDWVASDNLNTLLHDRRIERLVTVFFHLPSVMGGTDLGRKARPSLAALRSLRPTLDSPTGMPPSPAASIASGSVRSRSFRGGESGGFSKGFGQVERSLSSACGLAQRASTAAPSP